MGPELLQRIKELAEQAYATATPLDGRSYKGGYMCVVLGEGKPEVFAVGQPELHPEKEGGWKVNCRNKADRLLENPAHISAFQSYNLEAKKYYGGIRVRYQDTYLIITFSGLSQELDEALCAWMAVELECLRPTEWHQIRYLSGNLHMSDFGKIQPKIAA